MEHSQSTNLGKNCAPPSSVVACLILSMERRAAVVSGDTGAAVAAAAAMDFMLRSTTSGVSLLFGEVATASAAAFSTSLAISVALSECCL